MLIRLIYISARSSWKLMLRFAHAFTGLKTPLLESSVSVNDTFVA
jgi:hypothetical protein